MPALSSVLPIDPVTDRYQANFSSGDLDMEVGILLDAQRPLVFYGLDSAATIYLAKTAAGRLAITF